MSVEVEFRPSEDCQLKPTKKFSLKVLVIAQFTAIGGTRTYLHLLLDLLQAMQAEIVLVADINQEADCNSLQTAYPNIKILHPSGQTKSYPDGFPKCVLTAFWRLRSALLWGPYDLTIVSVSSGEIWLETLLLPWKVLYVVHTYPFWGKHARRLGNIFWRLIQQRLNQGSKIITVSQASRQVIQENWFPDDFQPHWIDVVYNPSRYSTDIVQSSSPKSTPSTTFTVLTVGHFESHKNPEFWIDIALTTKALAPDLPIEFIWVGGGSLLTKYQNYLKPYSWIRLVGECSDPTPYYQQASVYLQPSLVESQGMAVLEAAAFGVPAIVSDRGGLPESVVDGETGYVLALDTPWKFANAIVHLSKNLFLHDKLAESAKRRHLDVFNQFHWTKKMEQLIKQVVFTRHP